MKQILVSGGNVNGQRQASAHKPSNPITSLLLIAGSACGYILAALGIVYAIANISTQGLFAVVIGTALLLPGILLIACID